MITFRPMRQAEFSAYLDYFIPDYAAEIEANYALSAPDALRQVEREIASDLPAGPETAGQDLLCILSPTGPDELIGYIWYRSDDTRRSAFICDFCILPAQRGNGRGRDALRAFEAMLQGQGYDEIKLRVAADNARAQHIYTTGGFRVTGLAMAKRIGANGEQDREISDKARTPIR